MSPPIRRRLPRPSGAPLRRWALGALLAALLLGLLAPLAGPAAPAGHGRVGRPTKPLAVSSDALARRSPYNRPETYPLDRTPAAGLYLPHARWVGRLILPTVAEQARRPGDWVWIELEQTPGGSGLAVGQRRRLTWAEGPKLQGLVRSVTTTITLGPEAEQAAAAGNVIPSRLAGRRVGPLQTLAGARPVDDVVVSLEDVRVDGAGVLRIGRPPVQITGRWMGLAMVLGPAEAGEDPELFRVQHYEPANGLFTGVVETIRIPRQPLDRFGRRFFDARGIADTAVNGEGWTLYGAPAADGVFTVQALEPRALTRLPAWQTVTGRTATRRWISQHNWGEMERQRGRIAKVALSPDGADGGWRRGERALLIHSFGGIGGQDGEPVPGFTVTGHFAFGEARVDADPFTGEDRFSLRYHQIYANNPNGIVAGSQDWSAYGGDLQRGWLGTRPIADGLVQLRNPAVSELLLDELGLQAELLSARYRSGDGTGVAQVTAATSCVQDSGQALWIAIDQLRRQQAFASLSAEEQRRLRRLGQALEARLTPFGVVRRDWRHNGQVVAAAVAADPTASADRFVASQSPAAVLLSWRSMLPRRAHDDLSQAFLDQGLPLRLLRTNQIPGTDPRLDPLAPTPLLGQLPLASRLLARVSDGLSTAPWGRAVPQTILLLGLEAAIAIPLGRRSGLLASRAGPLPPWPKLLSRLAGLALMPALGEELIFRVLPLPQPLEGMAPAPTLAWLALSLGAFVAYHPLAARWWYPQGRELFNRGDFLVQCSLLGLVCGVAYLWSGSLWSAALIHWLTVVVWLEGFDGRSRLAGHGSLLLRRPGPDPETIR